MNTEELRERLGQTRLKPRKAAQLLKKAEKLEQSKWEKKRAVGREIRKWVESHPDHQTINDNNPSKNQ